MEDAALNAKYESLRGLLRGLGSVAVAFSGGVDSTLLLRVAHDVLGDKVLAVTAASETYPAGELAEAKSLAAEIGAPHVVIETRELDIAGFKNNPPDRCYHCKRELFGRIAEVARERGIRDIADGSNADDVNDYRPGERALAELGVLTPLRDAGLTKAEVRELSRQLGLTTWNKVACACLASRFPYGTDITPQKLAMVERAEAALHEIGFAHCRVRYHGDVTAGAVARIEVAPDRVGELVRDGAAGAIVRRLKEIGFRYVALDLEGYRTGSMNEALAERDRDVH